LNTLRYDVTGRVARITLDRPERANAITMAMPRELAECVEEANLDPSVHVIALTGSGTPWASTASRWPQMAHVPSSANELARNRGDLGARCGHHETVDGRHRRAGLGSAQPGRRGPRRPAHRTATPYRGLVIYERAATM